MIAYPRTSLEAMHIAPATAEWQEKKLIDAATKDKINGHYKNDLYTPNIFIRIGLFIFTCVIIGGVLGLVTLITYQNYESDAATSVRLILYGILTLLALEAFIRSKKGFRSGMDDALLYAVLSLLLAGLLILVDNITDSANEELFSLLLALPFLLLASIRYADRLLAGLACLSFFGIVFFAMKSGSKTALSFLPFAGMLLSALLYFINKKLQGRNGLIWQDHHKIIEILSLSAFYLSGNYFVVRELSTELVGIRIAEGQDIPFAFIFYACTLLIPIAYIVHSLRTKDRILLRCGLVILALSVLTFKYYFSLGHHELTLILAGVFLIGTAWMLLKYLARSRSGFTSGNEDPHLNTDQEAILIADTYKPKAATEGFGFGGGSSGGGGAGGNY